MQKNMTNVKQESDVFAEATSFEPMKREKFPPDSNKTKPITVKILKFIMDDHSFSLVENVVFQLLIERLEPIKRRQNNRKRLAHICPLYLVDSFSKHTKYW